MAETEFRLAPVEHAAGRIALVTIDNGDPGQPTTFGRHALESLELLLARLAEDDWAGLLLTGKPGFFAVGADIDEFPNASAELARAGSRAGHELFGRIRSLPYPTLAAINGACLGGGVELALHCDYRTISSAVRHFSCPEVFLGIFPAWGGTQLVPRLVGAEAAVRFIVENPLRQNRMLNGRKANELGFADVLLEPAGFLDDSLAVLAERAGDHPRQVAGQRDLGDLAEVVRKARARLEDQLHGAAPAPYAALDLIEGAAGWTLEEGYRAEEDAIAELLPGRQAQASIYSFDLVERRAKRGPGIPPAEPRPLHRVGVAGAGLMATQLASLFLRRLELPIVLCDVKQEIVDAALESIRGDLAGQVARGRYDEERAGALASLVTGSTSFDGFGGCDLVLEAVYEDLQVKQEVFAAVEEVVAPACVLATNTSALSITELGSGLRRPERLAGMHFFNPVAVMPLVELVRTPATDDVTLATAADVIARLGKRAVLVADAPGFVVNRVLTRMTRSLMDALEHGNTVDETDEAILRLGMPMAPSVLLQMVGPRVANHVLETMHEAFPDRFPLSPTLRSFAEGRDDIVVVEHAPKPVEEITDAALAAVCDEVARLLEDGVVADVRDVDTALLLGAGWPFFLGGTRFLDQTGVSERVLGKQLAEIGGR
ncbi:MAG: 3-hydroxyacyl-CoA dehydrogenase NAD-binding domain-containing protein [Gaiellaceae bacterium]